MPDDSDRRSAEHLDRIIQAASKAHESFVNQSIELDRAFAEGTLDSWLEEKLRQQMEAADGRDEPGAGAGADA